MSDYTKLNLKDEVEDMATGRMPPGIEAHFAREALGCRQSGVTYYKLGPDFHPPFGHKHNAQEEIYVVISGSARIKLDEEEIELGQLDAIRIAPDTTRAVKAGADGCEMIAYGAPKTEQQDAEMLPGWWE